MTSSTQNSWRGAFFEITWDLICTCEAGKIIYINPAGVSMLKAKTSAEVVGRSLSAFLNGSYMEALGGDLSLLLEETEPLPAKLVGLDGTSVDVELRVLALGSDEPGDYMILAHNITHRLISAHRIVDSETRYRALVQKALGGLFMCDETGITFANQAAQDMFMAGGPSELIGRSIVELLHRDYQQIFSEGVRPLLLENHMIPVRAVALNGKMLDVELAFIPLSADLNGPYVVDCRDISVHIQTVSALRHANEDLELRVQERTKELRREIAERMRAEEIIRHQATYDGLTGLPNRTLFFQRLSQEISTAQREGSRVDLLFIDLDGFKLVNDTLGHDAGDLLLKETANRLHDCVRSGDTVSRLGGDEFTAILPHLNNPTDAEHTAARVLETLARSYDLDGHPAHVSGSIGIAVFPEDAGNATDLVKAADTAMYRAKQLGKANYQFFTEVMNQQAQEREILTKALNSAMENQEFHIAYQPKVDLKTGHVVGLEALLRWKSGELGSVLPSRFIPVLEENTRMVDVGEWVARTALGRIKEWSKTSGTMLRLAVNVSARQLRTPGFGQILNCVLEGQGVPADALEIEIQEGSILKDLNQSIKILTEIRELGIHITIDDFGTGYSSLNFLQRLPIHAIKIDRTVIANMEEKEESRRTVKTIIAMAHGLGRKAVAEGVENAHQLALLREYGCDEGQGFLFSPPVATRDVAATIAKIKI